MMTQNLVILEGIMLRMPNFIDGDEPASFMLIWSLLVSICLAVPMFVSKSSTEQRMKS
jgi:hypothetical protein